MCCYCGGIARYLHGPVTEQHRYRTTAAVTAAAAAVAAVSQPTRGLERARHAGSHIRHNRFRFEATRRGCRSYTVTHIFSPGNGVPVHHIRVQYVNFIRNIIII